MSAEQKSMFSEDAEALPERAGSGSEPERADAATQAPEPDRHGVAEDGGTEGESNRGDASAAGSATAEPGASQSKSRRRRRRKKDAAARRVGERTGGESSEAAGSEEDAAASEGSEETVTSSAAAGPLRKESHLPFQRFFEGREVRRHAFAVGEIVAGRVLRVEHGAAVIDLFGKAIAFARANEPREVPVPLPGQTEAEEADESATPSSRAEAAPEVGEGSPSESAPEMATTSQSERVADPLLDDSRPSTRSVEAAHGPEAGGIAAVEDEGRLLNDVGSGSTSQAAHILLASESAVIEAGAEHPPDEENDAADPTSFEADAEEPDEEPATAAAMELEPPPLEVGTIFRGRIAAIAESGHIALHNQIVDRAKARAALQKAREERQRVWGLVFGFNRGGFDVLVEGLRAFCPASGMTLDVGVDPEPLLGRRLEFSVQQVKSGHQGIVVSRRSILEKEARERARELCRSIQPGQRIKGRVTQVREFGLFVDIGGLEGLVHLSELSWDRGVKPSDVAKPGDEVEVQVLRVSEPQGRKDREGRIALSLKALTPDPWETNLDGIAEGVARKGRVTRTTEFGAFVELAPGIEGLLHVSELGRDVRHANERVKEGDELYVVVERIDRKARRISLSKLSEQDAKRIESGQFEPASKSKVIQPGAYVKAKVERVDHTGLHVQVEGVLGKRGRGFIPLSEMGTERVTDHRKKFPPGTELEVKVMGFDRDGGLRLSRKAFCIDEERRAVQDYRREAAKKGFGTFGDLLRAKLGGNLGGEGG